MGLDLVELVVHTEEVFSINLPDEECAQISTVGDLYKLILKKLHLPYVPSHEIETQSLGKVMSSTRMMQLSNWTAPNVWVTLKHLIHDQLGIKHSDILESSRWMEDLRVD